MDGFPEYTVRLLGVGFNLLLLAAIPAAAAKDRGKPWVGFAVVSHGMAVVVVLDWAGYVVACDFYDVCAVSYGLMVFPMEPPTLTDRLGRLAWLIGWSGAPYAAFGRQAPANETNETNEIQTWPSSSLPTT